MPFSGQPFTSDWKTCSTWPPWIQRSSVRFGPMRPWACSPWQGAQDLAKRAFPLSRTCGSTAPASSAAGVGGTSGLASKWAWMAARSFSVAARNSASMVPSPKLRA